MPTLVETAASADAGAEAGAEADATADPAAEAGAAATDEGAADVEPDVAAAGAFVPGLLHAATVAMIAIAAPARRINARRPHA